MSATADRDAASQGKTDEAWQRILEDYPDIQRVTADGGLYPIEAKTIKKYREPRLMAKFDTSKSVAEPLRKLHLDILPTSRHSYVLGRFRLYEPFPSDAFNLRPKHITLPDLETLRVENLTSESNAINALLISRTLERFLGEEDANLIETFNGRMGTDDFTFKVRLYQEYGAEPRFQTVTVNGAQLEIDGGFESERSVSIMEAKNVPHDDFNIRQLYFPYRKYLAMVSKPIRLVFSQYTNFTYHLYEYEFTDPLTFSSISLVNEEAYTFEDRRITETDLHDVWAKTRVVADGKPTRGTAIPFPQADRMERVIALAERIKDVGGDGMTTGEVTEYMGVVPRQAAYYPAAGAYLGLFDRSTRGVVKLTDEGRRTLAMPSRERQLAYVGLIVRHDVFHQLTGRMFATGRMPGRTEVVELMRQLGVCNDSEKGSTINRRAQTVLAWIKWIWALVDDDE